jgi:hypothetical protein
MAFDVAELNRWTLTRYIGAIGSGPHMGESRLRFQLTLFDPPTRAIIDNLTLEDLRDLKQLLILHIQGTA